MKPTLKSNNLSLKFKNIKVENIYHSPSLLLTQAETPISKIHLLQSWMTDSLLHSSQGQNSK